MFCEEIPDDAEVLLSQFGDPLLLLKSQRQGEFRGDRFHVFSGNGWLFDKAPHEDDSLQLLFPCDRHPQRVTDSCKQAKDRVRKRSGEILFDGFSA
ncbi:MAG: hypothetical protein AUG55_03195 [Candidatus Rokubacteria bacterium 13_1_20CM_4_70_13]|nr:MAG: hypothetical protein AUG55_03195 [Candidatus Rokubacteria bacterium 13_1_20CM_4_70_13]